MRWQPLVKAVGMILLGMLGMGAFRVVETLVLDWRFLHTVRITQERRTAPNPQPQQKPISPAPSGDQP